MAPRRPHEAAGGRVIYFESTQIGNSVKTTAIDEATGTEVSVIGPATAMRSDLEKLAAAKLKRALEKASSPKQ